MKVKDLDLAPIVSIRLDEPVVDAAARMRLNQIGSLAIIDSGSVVGILTERDVVRAGADGVDMKRIPVRSYVTPGPATVSSDADVEDAAQMMLTLGVRHLPVVEGPRVVGMVSMRDVLFAELALATAAVC